MYRSKIQVQYMFNVQYPFHRTDKKTWKSSMGCSESIAPRIGRSDPDELLLLGARAYRETSMQISVQSVTVSMVCTAIQRGRKIHKFTKKNNFRFFFHLRIKFSLQGIHMALTGLMRNIVSALNWIKFVSWKTAVTQEQQFFRIKNSLRENQGIVINCPIGLT